MYSDDEINDAEDTEDRNSDPKTSTTTLNSYQTIRIVDEMDSKFGFENFKEAKTKSGWLLNMHSGEMMSSENQALSVVNYYFLEEDGSRFRVSLPFKPYFYIVTKESCETEVCVYLTKKYAGDVVDIETVCREDLNLPNHLTGLQRCCIKLSFLNINNMMKVKRDLMPRIRRNREKEKSKSTYTALLTSHFGGQTTTNNADLNRNLNDQIDNIVDIREHDVPYHVRVSIDLKVFVGLWYDVTGRGIDDIPEINRNGDLIDRPEPVVLAFDIETTKEVLKFPDAKTDKIMMISYMIDGKGFLIVNREIVSQDIDHFEYTPRPEYEGVFTVYNEQNEYELLIRFFEHIQLVKPNIFVTYNGDFFDWPFVETRAESYGLSMRKEIGFAKDNQGEYKATQAIHMDAFRWVKRDSYLPMGSQNLKACTRAKLRYDPQELDPELMVQMAREQPKVLASYSVSDAVATYYLYMKYVHPFIFALCTIIPMEPDEVLRKGSGTLCEALLMVEAFHCNIVLPNKQEVQLRKVTDDGRLIESETYVGGHVEALESGVFRADLPCRFRLDPQVLATLKQNLRRTMEYSIRMEGIEPQLVLDLEQKCQEVELELQKLIDCPNRLENPIIYHLDVGAMYPNIILTNRLQPQSIIDDTVCAACDFNRADAKCKRKMEWMWRAEVTPANRGEYQRILQQLENETFAYNNASVPFHQLPREEQAKIEKKRLQDYCRKAYRRLHESRSELRQVTVCQRENSFYVDTVRAFRDRRYEYKALLKGAKKKLEAALKTQDASEIKSCKSKEVLYDSLQTAHKCILNSFYGYVMRKGSRWHSMQMAGIVCYTGAQIITKAKELVEKIGRPLELDTDGIWCILPAGFPENVTFATQDSKRPVLAISYPGAALNIMIRDDYTNHQYHSLVDAEKKRYKITAENSIAFEVDGPYRAMVLPASKEEGKRLKKRYAVFNFDGSLAELKGFEVKRRGELQLIKNFQSSVFDAFLKGGTLQEVYQCAASVADYWLDVLFSKASCVSDKELFELLSENRNLSRKLSDYGNQKSTSITVAKRLAEFLGDEMVKDAGLNCKIIIATKPDGAPVTERALPAVIFQAEASVMRHYLKKWTKCSNLPSFDIRDILDWSYYIERLGSAIQKIITIPAALQGVANPVPRVAHPEWLHKRLLEKNDVMKQRRITDMFRRAGNAVADAVPPAHPDIENIVASGSGAPVSSAAVVVTRKRALDNDKVPKSKRQVPPKRDLLTKTWRQALGDPKPFGKTLEQRQSWLVFLKSKWGYQVRRKLEAKRQQRSAVSGLGQYEDALLFNKRRRLSNSAGLDSFVQRSVQNLFETTWKIVQFLESHEPGLFYVWIFVSKELRKVKLRVPRTFYINSKVPKENESSEAYTKVQRILPRSNQVYNLYRYSVPEEKFQQHVNHLMVESSAPDIEGVYETQVPLNFRLMVDLGCACRLLESRRVTAYESETFMLTDFEFVSLVHCDYLDSDTYGNMFLYHYGQDTRAIWALFIPLSRQAHVWILDKGQNKNVPNLEALYESERTKKCQKDGAVPDSGYKFEVQVCLNAKDIYRNLQKLVRVYKDEKRGPTFVPYISKWENKTLLKLMPSLSDFPLIKLRINQPDSLFNTLDWQRVGCRYMVNYFINYPNYFQTYLELCRYLHIPLGNVPSDFAQFGADLFYARNLQRQNCVLWAAVTDRPDLGGKEVDNNRLVTDFLETHEVKFNESGFYKSYCVELDVASLPVAAILQAHKISQLEGVSAATGFDTGQSNYAIDSMVATSSNNGGQLLASYDETALCAYSFRILKTVVHSWVKDVASFSNKFADNQIVHFYRWLRSSTSLMYEPALKKMLNDLMKKLFLLLISELKHLNVHVVFADWSKVIICTNKRTSRDALSYVQFILESLGKNDLFSPLDISVAQTWRLLLWLDPANFGGIKFEEKATNLEIQVLNEDELTVDMNWNLMHFLPELAECQANFSTLVAGYILIVYQFVEQQAEQCRVSQALDDSASTSLPRSTQSVCKNEHLSRNVTCYCQQLIGGQITQKLLAIVQKMQRKITVGAGDGGVRGLFPTLPGSHLNFSNPALEFAKSMCKVLGLDAGLQDESAALKRTLLKCLGIGEFSDEAGWIDPCLSYVLPELICKHCGHCRDVDLCRDPYVYEQPSEFARWRCVRCSREYDLAETEQVLVQHLNRWLMSYCLQDAKCGRCRMVRMGNLDDRCECSGRFECLLPPANLAQTFSVLANLARCYKMHNLTEALDTVNSKQPN